MPISSTSEMIRRALEAPATSPAERLALKRTGQLSEMWYANKNDLTTNNDYSKFADDYFSSSLKNSLEQSLDVGRLKDYSNAHRDRSSWDGLESVEDIIAKDIKRLERGVGQGASHHHISQANPYEVPSTAWINPYSRHEPKEVEDPRYRSSLGTLGGVRGLLIDEYKLDGRVAPAPPPPPPNSHIQAAEVCDNMDELMKHLGGPIPAPPPPDPAPDPNDVTIPQVPLKLMSELSHFNAYFERKHKEEDAEVAAQKAEADKLVEEGKRLEREAQDKARIELEKATDPRYEFTRMLRELEMVTGTSEEKEEGTLAEEKIDWQHISLDDAVRLSSVFKPRGNNIGALMFKQEATARHMKALRHQLGLRIGALDEMYAATMTPDTARGAALAAAAEDTGHIGTFGTDWNPYPELLHHNIFNADEAIGSVLDSAMQTLHLQLPTEDDKKVQQERWKERESLIQPAEIGSVGDISNKLLDAMRSLRTNLDSEDADALVNRWTGRTMDSTPLPTVGRVSPPPSYRTAVAEETSTDTGPSPEPVVTPAPEPTPTPTPPVVPLKDGIAALDSVLGKDDSPPPKSLIDRRKPKCAKDVGLPDIDKSTIDQYVSRLNAIGLKTKVPERITIEALTVPSAPTVDIAVPTVPSAPVRTASVFPPLVRAPIEGQAIKVYRQSTAFDRPPELLTRIDVPTTSGNIPMFYTVDSAYLSSNSKPSSSASFSERKAYLKKMQDMRSKLT